MTRILILQRFDLSSVSCARRVLCQTEELLRRGHEVILTDFVHPGRQETIPALVNLSNMGATLVPLPRQVQNYLYNLLKLLRIKPKPEIIHLWKSYPDASLPALFLSRWWKVPLHYDWDDWETGIAAELTGSQLAGWLASRWDRLLPQLCDTMTVASGFLREQALAWGAKPQRMWDAPVGADLERFYPRPFDENLLKKLNLQKPVLVYSGQLEVASYAEQAVEVLKRVRQRFHTASLLILGGGRKLEAIRQRAEELHISKHVVLTDYIPGDSIPLYLSIADIALAPFENNNVTCAKSPLKIAEYMAMGLPIVASDVGDVKKMTVGAAVTVPCGDVEEMARQVCWLLTYPGIQKSMSIAGQNQVRTLYNWKTHTDTLETAYQTAIADNLREYAHNSF